MFENLLDEVLTEYYLKEFPIYSTVPEHNFSLKHRIAMKKIFKRYERNTKELRSKPAQGASKLRFTPKRLSVLAIIIILAALAGCTAAYFISQSFRGEVYSDNTELFPINLDNCPTIIEEKYYLPELPEGFEISYTNSTPFHEFVSYRNEQTGQIINFDQCVKSEFGSTHYNTEKGELVEVEINGHSGVLLDRSDDNQNYTNIIWDNGDYILKLLGNLDKNDLLNLAKCAKVLDN